MRGLLRYLNFSQRGQRSLRTGVILSSFISLFLGDTAMAAANPLLTLRQKIGQMIMVGFEGTKLGDKGVDDILPHVRKGEIGGLVFFRYNITSPQQIQLLTSAFRQAASSSHLPLLLAVDQEGGKVQRLSSKNGFEDFPSAETVAKTLTPQQAYTQYRSMAHMVKSAGFNMNFGPVVDLRGSPHDPSHKPVCPVIGQLERSFSDQIETIVIYATSFIKAHHEEGIIPSPKHYPGHGLARTDSHKGMVDITLTYKPFERKPFQSLIQQGYADIIMCAHLIDRHEDSRYPITLSSRFILPKLRKEDGFQGVVITDDLHMGAIQQHYSLKETVIRAIQAGNDILLFSNNIAAAQGVKDFKLKPNLVEQIITLILNAVKEGTISQARIEESFERIKSLKRRLR